MAPSENAKERNNCIVFVSEIRDAVKDAVEYTNSLLKLSQQNSAFAQEEVNKFRLKVRAERARQLAFRRKLDGLSLIDFIESKVSDLFLE